jgi:ABC-type glycerol-3-phosphate transport system substrate-binding protein
VRKGRLLLPAFLLLIASALALSACGSSESDEDKVVNAIETAAVSTDPADCEALQTVNFMEQSNEGEGKEAIEECEEDAEDQTGNPDSVDVEEVEVEGSNATANVAFIGGDADGQTLVVALVEEEDDWKLDEINGFAKFDREKLVAGILKGLEDPSSGLSSAQAECIGEGIEGLEDEAVEELMLDPSAASLVEIAEECQ